MTNNKLARQTRASAFAGGGNDEEASASQSRRIPPHDREGQPDGGRRRRHRHVLRSLAAQPRLGAGRQADQARPHLRRQRPVRQQRPGRHARHPPRHRRVQRQGRRARPQDRVDHRRHRDQPGDRHARRRALHRPGAVRLPDRRAAFGRRQRHHPGRQQVRHRLPQHQLLGAERGRRELLARQVRVGRQRHQLLQGRGAERGGEDRQELAAAHQRLRLGPHHLGGDQGAGGEGRRPDHRQPADPAEHARLHLLSAQGAADRSPTWSRPPSAATTSRRCASR